MFSNFSQSSVFHSRTKQLYHGNVNYLKEHQQQSVTICLKIRLFLDSKCSMMNFSLKNVENFSYRVRTSSGC